MLRHWMTGYLLMQYSLYPYIAKMKYKPDKLPFTLPLEEWLKSPNDLSLGDYEFPQMYNFALAELYNQ